MIINLEQKVLAISATGAIVLHYFKSGVHGEASKYRDSEGKFTWWAFAIDSIAHMAMAIIGALIVFNIFEMSVLVEYKEAQFWASIFGGFAARETFPILLDLLVDEVKHFAEERKRTR